MKDFFIRYLPALAFGLLLIGCDVQTAALPPSFQATNLPVPQPTAACNAETVNAGTLAPSTLCVVASPNPNPSASPSGSGSVTSGSTITMKATFYDAESSGTLTYDATAPGGSGTYADPITMATDYSEIPDKTIIYVKGFDKYYIHSDLCAACVSDWNNGQQYHIDLWVGTDPSSGVGLDPGNCAIMFGAIQVPVIVNPPSTLTVSSQPIETSGGQCFPLPSPFPTS